MAREDIRARSHRLRRGRVSERGRLYLVTTVTFDRTPFFSDFRNGRAVVHAVRSFSPVAETWCFVVMPDHLHWLLQLSGPLRLDQVVGGVKSMAARQCHAIAGSRGKVWQSGFQDRALRREEDVRSVARYIIANPLRAGLVSRLGDYPLWDAKWL